MTTDQTFDDVAYSFYFENEHKIKSWGLSSGKAGEIMILLLLYQYLKRDDYLEKANLLLEDIAIHISQVKDPGFMLGLSGIGWLIEWIAQNGFMEINTDKVLEEVDDRLYKTVLFTTSKDISVYNGIVGKALYFLNRHQSKNYGTHRYKTICHEECLVLLTDALQQKLLEKDGLLMRKRKLALSKLKQVGDALIFLTKLSKTRINWSVVEDCIYKITNFVENKLPSIEGNNGDIDNSDTYESFYLSYCYWKAGVIFKCKKWELKGLSCLRFYIKNNNYVLPQSTPRIDWLFLLVDLRTQLDIPEYSKIIDERYQNICKDHIPPFLKNGFGSLVLSGLNLKYNRKYNWQEILICC